MLAYLKLKKLFVIYTDARYCDKMGVISCFMKKLGQAQMKNPTTEQELLAAAETLKCHHNIINGGHHKNQPQEPDT